MTKRSKTFEEDGPYAVSWGEYIVFRFVVRHQKGFYLYGTRDMANHTEDISFSDAEKLDFVVRILWWGGPQ